MAKDKKKEFRKYIDFAVDRYFKFYELQGNSDDIRNFSIMISMDSMLSKSYRPFSIKMTDKMRKELDQIALKNFWPK